MTRPSRPIRALPPARLAWLAPLSTLVLAACGHEAPGWTLLRAEEGRRSGTIGPIQFGDEGPALDVEGDGLERSLTLPLRRADWSPSSDSSWKAEAGFRVLFLQRSLGFPTLTAGERTFTWIQSDLEPGAEDAIAAGSFQTRGSQVFLWLAAGERPPDEAHLRLRLPQTSGSEIHTFGFAGQGAALLPGESVSWNVAFPADSRLRLRLAAEPWNMIAEGALTCRVRFGEEPVQELIVSAPGSTACSVALPAEGGEGTLSFSFEGLPATLLLLDPTIGPSEVGRAGQRPWGRTCPDILVFLADTLRADCLGAYGCPLPLTPFLDELAERSVLFERAWSAGTFTLSAHASLFTGLYPHEAGISSSYEAMPDAIETIAERLQEQGYRTGAITDSAYVSRVFGMQQGFGTFDERPSTLDETLARARDFLAADDGRPVFLFVHTYRVHTPYVVSPGTRRRLGERLGLGRDYATLRAELVELAGREGVDQEDPAAKARFLATPEARSNVREQEALYYGGIADLDEGLRPFVEELEHNGFLDTGYLVFTSDHGESFGEHGTLHHGGKTYEVETRIPLLIHGGGLSPTRIDRAVSLVDLAPTLATLADIPVPVGWGERSLLTPRKSGPIYAFQCDGSDASTLTVVEGDRKVIGWEDADRVRAGDFLGAFDLAADPGEQAPLPSGSFGAELLGRHARALEQALTPAVEPVEAQREEKIELLRALGYVGD